MKKLKQIKKKQDKLIKLSIFALILIILIILFIYFYFKGNNTYKSVSRNNEIIDFKNNHKKLNVDGWLKVQGTNIDYPIIYDDKDTNIEKIEDDFLWKIEKFDNLSKRTVIFGHNIKNVSSNPLITFEGHSRFEQLMSFIYYDFAKDNQFIQYTKNNKNYIFQIFSVSLINERDMYFSEKFYGDEYKKYIDKAIEDSFYKYDIDVSEDDKIISLITCTRFYGGLNSYRFKIEGKLVEENSEIVNIKKKDNYKKIENIMKEGESYEKQI